MNLHVNLWTTNHARRKMVVPLGLVALLAVGPQFELIWRIVSTANYGATALLEIAEV